MKTKTYFIVGMIIAAGLFYEITAHADEADQATTMTFSAPIQVPGQVLPAGTYLFKTPAGESGQNMVQIFNADGTALYATLQTISTERQEATGDTVITLAEEGNGKPEALLNWFYPGRVDGNEFVYPQQEEKQLAHAEQQTIVVNQPTASNSDGNGAGA